MILLLLKIYIYIYYGSGATIRIGRESWCLPYAFFFSSQKWQFWCLAQPKYELDNGVTYVTFG